MEWGWDNARALLGIVMIFGIAWGLSENRKAFRGRSLLAQLASSSRLLLSCSVFQLFVKRSLPPTSSSTA